jgi:hypothetical protein
VRAIAVFPDGRRIVTGGDDTVIRVWDLRTGELLHYHEEHENEVLAVATTDDGRVVSCSRTATIVWDVTNGLDSRTPHPGRVTGAAISPGGAAVAVSDVEGGIRWILPPRGGHDFRGGHRRVDSIAVTAGGQLITAGAEPLVRVVDSAGNEVRTLTSSDRGDVTVAASADGERIAITARGRVSYWDRGQPTDVPLTGCEDAVTLAVAPDGQIAAGGLRGGIWAWSPGRDPNRPVDLIAMIGHGSPVRAFAVTPGQRLVSGAQDGSIRLWDLRTGIQVDPGIRRQAGHAGDQESEVDLLGFAEDVEGMAALVMDRKTAPAAIALLGRWGSGKSSFMRQLHTRIARLAEQGGRSPRRSAFATVVRQVRFDAWHYNDDHLWVGMVEHLFAGLAEPSPPDADEVRAERDVLRGQLRNLEELDDPKATAGRRIWARLRLWSASLAPRRGRITVASIAAVLLGVVTGVAWWLVGNAVLTGVLGVLTAAAASPLVPWLVSAWRAARELAGRHARDRKRAVRDTRVQLARLDAAQRLALAIEEASSGGYDRYRGLLGRVHADLRLLSDSAREAFAEWDDAGPEGLPPLERVILYVDDLDRCSPRKVVDVLAAVHLLLALPLFVVVVAVDPRWLRRCLEQYHSELFAGRPDGAGGATPLDYLDKIFQIVFALRPMGSEADHLITTLVPADMTSPVSPEPDPDRPGESNGDQGGHVMPGIASPDNSSTQVPQPEPLRLRADEIRFIQRLRPLLATPRAVKRLVNLYRLVRATVADDDGFVGTDGTGPYQAVLVLLAVLVSAPEDCRVLIERLQLHHGTGSVVPLIEELASGDGSPQARDVWTRLLDVIGSDPVDDTLPTYRTWAGVIARFSFETWDLTTPR